MPFPSVRRTFGSLLALAVVAPLLAACTSTGDISNPLTRKASYFSYLNGDDIRATCRPGADDRLRLTFNGRYQDQVRLYELQHQGGRPVLSEKVLSPLVINQGFTLSSLSEHLNGTDSSTILGDSRADALWQAMTAAGALSPATPGQRLDSETLWWMAVGCRSGQTFFHVWQQDENVGPPPFSELIQSLDSSTLPWPSTSSPPVTGLNSPRDRSQVPTFTLETTASGLLL